jgi:hypothetical protein
VLRVGLFAAPSFRNLLFVLLHRKRYVDDIETNGPLAVRSQSNAKYEGVLAHFAGLIAEDSRFAAELLTLVTEHQRIATGLDLPSLFELVFHFEQVRKIGIGLDPDLEIEFVLSVVHQRDLFV